MTNDSYVYRDLLATVISPTAIAVLERLTPAIVQIYQLDALLDAPVPADRREEHQEQFSARLARIVRLLPPDISPLPNEVFTAVEFLIYEIQHEPVHLGLAIARLEELGDEIRADPLLHSLVTGRAN